MESGVQQLDAPSERARQCIIGAQRKSTGIPCPMHEVKAPDMLGNERLADCSNRPRIRGLKIDAVEFRDCDHLPQTDHRKFLSSGKETGAGRACKTRQHKTGTRPGRRRFSLGWLGRTG